MEQLILDTKELLEIIKHDHEFGIESDEVNNHLMRYITMLADILCYLKHIDAIAKFG